MRPDPFSLLALTFGASSYLRSNGCDSVATYFKFLFGAALRREFSVRLADTYLIREPVMSNAGLQSDRTAAATGTRRAVFNANDVRTLIANNLRSLICRCPTTLY
jgi:hypothetical protein